MNNLGSFIREHIMWQRRHDFHSFLKSILLSLSYLSYILISPQIILLSVTRDYSSKLKTYKGGREMNTHLIPALWNAQYKVSMKIWFQCIVWFGMESMKKSLPDKRKDSQKLSRRNKEPFIEKLRFVQCPNWSSCHLVDREKEHVLEFWFMK